jgi:hypothetical protein
MKTRLIIALFVTLLICLPDACQAQDSNNDTCRVAWSEAWSWGNALAVQDHFERLYIPHASALLAADQRFAGGAAPKDILDSFRLLPGIKGVVFCGGSEGGVQSPEGLVEVEILSEFILNRKEAVFQAQSPMMKRMMGGQVRFIRAKLQEKYLDLMVRYIRTEVGQPSQAAICVILDKDWLLARIPSQMDSLARENAQLLFWAASPTNQLEEQSLGIILGSDRFGGREEKTLKRQIYKLSGLSQTSRFIPGSIQ